MDALKSQVNGLLERVSTLEQREIRSSDEILNLTRENTSLMRQVETSSRRVEEFNKQVASLQQIARDNKTIIDRLETTVTKLKQENQKSAKEQNTELDKLRKELDRGLEQSRQKAMKEGEVRANSRSGFVQGGLQEKMDDLVSFQETSKKKHQDLVDRIRAIDRKTGCLQAVQEQVDYLTKWTDEREDNSEKLRTLDKSINSLTRKVDDLGDSTGRARANVEQATPMETSETERIVVKAMIAKHAVSSQSVFCAQLLTHGALRRKELIKINNCASILHSRDGYFDQTSGTLIPKEEGIYNLSWKVHQGGDGEIRFLMAINGLNGRIFLGNTEKSGDVCSGTLFVPLKKQQNVWIEAQQIRGPDARVFSCNFMGWLMDLCTLDSQEVISNLQEGLFRPIKSECQHM